MQTDHVYNKFNNFVEISYRLQINIDTLSDNNPEKKSLVDAHYAFEKDISKIKSLIENAMNIAETTLSPYAEFVMRNTEAKLLERAEYIKAVFNKAQVNLHHSHIIKQQ